jgi:hypothetical protein
MIVGRYQDTIVTVSGAIRVASWRSNLIVTPCFELVAALMKRQPGTTGLLWWAFGSGETARASVGDRTLAREIHRQEVREEQMQFVDERGGPRAAPTNRLEVRTAIRADRFDGETLTEFGLFGGNAGPAPNSGVLVNHVVHPPLTLLPEELLERTLVLSFGQSGLDVPFGVFGAALPVRAIHGVDDLYSTAFAAGGVRTIDDLARLEYADRFPAMPAVTFRAFIDKALIVRRFQPLRILDPFAELSLFEFLELSPDQIVSRFGGSLEAARDAQRSVGILQVALDAEYLRRISVGSLFTG